MKKFKSKAGHVVYEATSKDTEKLGGYGVCDYCGNYAEKGYLIAVLNSYYCPDCFKDWEKTARNYPEDRNIEKRREKYYDSVFFIGR